MKCEDPDCALEATFNCARIESRRGAAENNLCDGHGETLLSEFCSSVSIGAGKQHPNLMPGEVCVDL